MSERSARAASRARATALARTRTPRTSSGKRTSATWPCLLRSTSRKTPHAANRRTASRVGHVERLIFCARHGIEKCILRFPSSRLCRNRWIYTMWSITPSCSCGTTTSSICFHSAFASISLCAPRPPLSSVSRRFRLLPVDFRRRKRSDTPIPLRLRFFMIGDPVGAEQHLFWSAAALLPPFVIAPVEARFSASFLRPKNTLTPAFSIRGKPQGGAQKQKRESRLRRNPLPVNSTIFYDFVK